MTGDYVMCPGKCGKMIRADQGHRCGETAVEELLRHLEYVCTIAERLGPGASSVHREEALYMLKGTVKEARDLIARHRTNNR